MGDFVDMLNRHLKSDEEYPFVAKEVEDKKELPKVIIVGIGQPEFDKILEDGFFDYYLIGGYRLRLVLEDKEGKMDERGLVDEN